MPDQPLSYWVAVAGMGFEDDFNRLFEELGISQAELALRLSSSEAYVSKVLSGRSRNYQLQTMVKLARAIGGVVQVRVIKEEGEAVRVVDYETARALDERQKEADSHGYMAAAQSNLLYFPPRQTTDIYRSLPVSVGAGGDNKS